MSEATPSNKKGLPNITSFFSIKSKIKKNDIDQLNIKISQDQTPISICDMSTPSLRKNNEVVVDVTLKVTQIPVVTDLSKDESDDEKSTKVMQLESNELVNQSVDETCDRLLSGCAGSPLPTKSLPEASMKDTVLDGDETTTTPMNNKSSTLPTGRDEDHTVEPRISDHPKRKRVSKKTRENVEESVESLAGSKPKRARKPVVNKPKQQIDDINSEGVTVMEIEAPPPPTVVMVEIDSPTRQKLELYKAQQEEYLAELAALESAPESSDSGGNLPLAPTTADQLVPGLSLDAKTDSGVTAVDKPTATSGAYSRPLLAAVAVHIQGSDLPMSALSEKVAEILKQYQQQPSDLGCVSSPSSNTNPCDIITKLAERKAYGQLGKAKSQFEDTEPQAVLRWEMIDLSYVTSTGKDVIERCRVARRLYGRIVKNIAEMLKYLNDKPAASVSDDKFVQLEERYFKTKVEVEKARLKRAEVSNKKRVEEEERAEKELKRRAKEEEIEQKKRANKEDAERKKREKEEETERKQREKEEEARKQEEVKAAHRKKLDCLWKSLAKPTSKTPPETTAAVVGPDGVVDLSVEVAATSTSTATASSGVADVRGTGSVARGPVTAITTSATNSNGLDVAAFEEILRGDKAMDRSALYPIGRSSQPTRITATNSRRHRKPIVVNVTVSTPNLFGALDENRLELKDVQLDSRMRLLSFHTDFRPPYWGTWSKTSRAVNGRRPFGRDMTLDYDYDSEAEWEEVDDPDAEDIAASDGEEDAEGNELEYDDFFLRDNDYGSDLGSDGEEVSASRIKDRREVATVAIGPVFLEGEGVSRMMDGQLAPTSAEFEGSRDVARLRSFVAVIHAWVPRPELGGSLVTVPETAVAVAPSDTSGVEDKAPVTVTESGAESSEKKSKVKPFKEELLPELMRAVHGRRCGIDVLVDEFCAAHEDLPKAQIKRQIQVIASRERSEEGFGSVRWRVKKEEAARLAVQLQPVPYTPPKPSKGASKPSTGNKSILEYSGAKRPRSSGSERVTTDSSEVIVLDGSPNDGSPNAGVASAVSDNQKNASGEGKGKAAVAAAAEKPEPAVPTTPSVVTGASNPSCGSSLKNPVKSTNSGSNSSDSSIRPISKFFTPKAAPSVTSTSPLIRSIKASDVTYADAIAYGGWPECKDSAGDDDTNK